MLMRIGPSKNEIDTRKLIESFNAAAGRYQEVSVLQIAVGEQLLDRLGYMKTVPGLILDLGSGPGVTARSLSRLYPDSRIIEMDIAENMLNISRNNSKKIFSRHNFICADAQQAPVRTRSIDVVFSNLMLQWCNSLDQLFREIFRALNNNGLFIFSTLGPDTLQELRTSWAAVDDQIHVNTFIDMHDLGDALTRAGFESPVMETDYITLTYDKVYDLMGELKKLGAHNINTERHRGLTGKNSFFKMCEEYEKRRSNCKLPATYEVIYGHAWVPDIDVNMVDARGQTFFPVDVLRKTLKKFSR